MFDYRKNYQMVNCSNNNKKNGWVKSTDIWVNSWKGLYLFTILKTPLCWEYINVENDTHCFSKKCTCARATINFERYSLFDKFILYVLFFRLSSHSFTDLSDRSVF